MDNTFAVVLAGGFGTRLWPLSRRHHPKQFLDLTGDGNMLRITVSRLSEMLPIHQIFVSTIPDHVRLVRETLPELPAGNLIVEPVKRGTGPCIGLALLHVERISADATMLIVPADHIVDETEKYIRTLSTACEVASDSDSLVTIGLKPAYAATNYGYIKIDEPVHNNNDERKVLHALGFVEKPDRNAAKQFYEAGEYLWNTGTFAWSIESLRSALREVAPELAKGVEAIRAQLQAGASASEVEELYASLPNISIDYALMEHATNILVLLGEYRRLDVGDLNALAQIWPTDENENAGRGIWMTHKSTRNIVHSSGQLVALVGVDDMIVVVTDDVVLVCARDQSQEVRSLVHELDTSIQARYL